MPQYFKHNDFLKRSPPGYKQKVLVRNTSPNNENNENNSKKLLGEKPYLSNSNRLEGLSGSGALLSKKYDTAYSKLSEVKLITIGLASPEKIRQWAEKTLPNKNKTVLGQVTNANTLHHKTFKPQKGGLFCERIFGPLKDFQCACGITIPTPVSSNLMNSNLTTGSLEQQKLPMEFLSKPLGSTLQGPTAQVTRKFCNKCDVEYTWSVIRRYQLGYIQLVSPVTHVWYLKGSPSYLSILLDMKKRHLEYVTYCTESLTLENSLKANTSRLTKIPSEMLEMWKQTVLNGLPLGKSKKESQKIKIYELYKERKKQKRFNTKIQKRFLPLVLTSAVENVFVLNSENNPEGQRGPVVKFNTKFLILLSLIHKHVYLTNLMDFKNELIESLIFDCFDKFSLKQLLKKLPTSLYLFYNLQLVLQKEFFLLLCNKFWKELYLTSLKESLQKSILLSNSQKWDNQQQNNLDVATNLPFLSKMQQMKVLISSFVETNNQSNSSQQSVSNILGGVGHNNSYKALNVKKLPTATSTNYEHQETLIFIEMAKQQWFLSFLLCIKKLKSTDLLLLNYPLLTNYKLTNQLLINSLAQNTVNLSLLKTNNSTKNDKVDDTNLWGYPHFRSPKGPKLDVKLSSFNNSFLTFVEPILNKYSDALNHAFFNVFLQQLTFTDKNLPSIHTKSIPYYSFFSESLSKPQGLLIMGIAHNKNSSTQWAKHIVGKTKKRDDLLSYIFLANVKKQYNFLEKAMNNSSIRLESVPFILNPKLKEVVRDCSWNKGSTSISNLKFSPMNNFYSGEFVCSIFSSLKNIYSSFQDGKVSEKTSFGNDLIYPRGTIKDTYQSTKGLKKKTKAINKSKMGPQKTENKFPKLGNNIYCVSHRERWMDEEWQNFIDYMSMPFNETVLFSKNRPDKIALSIIPAYKNQIFVLKNEFSSVSNQKNKLYQNNAEYSGPGIIQQLLNEFDFSELQKIDKQNRILLYQLNKHIFSLKKHLQKPTKKELKKLKDCYKKRDQLIRRTKLIRTFFRKDSKPNSMILTILPVLPPDLRPIVKIGGQIAASDLNRLYQRVIYRNDRLKKFLKEPGMSSSYEMKYAQRLLQEAVDNLIQNGKSGSASEKDARGRALKSLSDLLKGKQGRFRQYLLGKRVDYSGRSVIVVGPKLKLHECGLPKEMAVELYLPFLLKRILNHNYARTVVGAKTLMKQNPDLVWELLKEIMQTCPVLLNRAPTLHRLGIQAFQPKLIEGRAILLHPLVCPAFNADFDGDQMAVHVPITVEARAEAWKLMCGRQNFLSPATGEPLAIPSQDMVLGCYYLTTHCNKSTIKYQQGSGFYFNNFSDVLNAYHRKIVDLHAFVWVKFDSHLEQGNDQDDPLEIRINIYGQWTEIYQYIQNSYSKNNTPINQYICTTPGRILFNFIIQKTLVKNLVW
uniref:DNA-directed RNA polymerase subunit beta' n=1 Tax=Phacotus lenticularis TaxID=52965 RepID=A0A0S2LQ21_9CHLO|nr:beta' subunit of RNA polymerase [Phacotus lenticularis]ALO63612.1 beta' subunit of RNA polymerase [Phacotus lenticularis]